MFNCCSFNYIFGLKQHFYTHCCNNFEITGALEHFFFSAARELQMAADPGLKYNYLALKVTIKAT